MEGTRDPQNARTSTRLTDRRKLELEEKERKMEHERKRAKTRFQRKNKVIGPHDMIVDTTVGKINLGPEYVSEDVKVKVESGFSEGQGQVVVTQEVNIKMEDAPAMMEEEDGDCNPVYVKNDTTSLVEDSNENKDNGNPMGGEFQDVAAVRTEGQLLTAMVEQLKKEMKQRLGEQDQQIVQLTTELAAVKAEVASVKKKGAAKINELQETIAQLQLQLSSTTKDVQEGIGAKKGLVSTGSQLQGQVSQGHLLAQNELDHQGNPDQDDFEDMEIMSPESNDNCVTDVLEPLPQEKSRNGRIEALLFEAVLNILVQRGRTIDGKLNWSRVCGILKKCRLVCQSWKASVDHVLQSHPSHLEFRNPSDLKIIGNQPPTAPCPLSLSTVEKTFGVNLPLDIAPSEMEQFIMNLPLATVDSNYNPVPTRHLSVKTPRLPSLRFVIRGPEPLVKIKIYQISDYLRVFGPQVLYLRLSLGYGLQGKDFDEVCSTVSEILDLVPNLRLLSLNLDHVVSVAERATLAEMEYHFPRLKHLVAVECPQENPVIVQILKANSHVRNLAFHQLWYRQSTGIFQLDLPNLSELFISYNDQIKMDLFRRAKVTWKIRKLHLQLAFPRRVLSANSIQTLIDGLTVFGGSLEDLKLEFGNHDFDLEGRQLKLPRLKRLYVQSNKWNDLEWDLLLAQLKLLESLEIVGDREDPAMISSFHEEQYWLTLRELRSVTLIAKKRFGDPIVTQEERTMCTGCKLKRVGMPTVKFNYIKVSFS